MANDTSTPQLHCALKYHFFIGLIFLCLYVAIISILMVIYSTVYRRNLRWLCPKKKVGKNKKEDGRGQEEQKENGRGQEEQREEQQQKEGAKKRCEDSRTEVESRRETKGWKSSSTTQGLKIAKSSVHRLLVMSQSTILFVFLTGCSLSVLGSGLFHHDAWHPHHLDHHDHESHGHDGEWGSKHGDGWGENHADAHDHAHEAGYAKGDAQDWARLDYGGHKNHASGDSYAHGYANEHGDGHGGEAGWANGHDGAHSHHSAHAHHPHHFDGHHGHFDAPHYFGGHHGHFPHHFDDHHLNHDWH
ncbi:hypothetical protein M3Y98_00683700 [Aphelenchoides besseyi]|nr:hypothetical protein M3Y98_00683700 [Aphelenchoides besseyi]